MKLSLILCSRNDEYMGNSRWRLETALNSLGHRLHSMGRSADVEVLVADWGSAVPLSDVLSLEPAAASIVSFVSVPPEIARVKQRDSPFPEVLALNAAARRARGEYIGRIDQDTIVGRRFLRWFFDDDAARAERRETALWFANRRDIPYRLASRCPNRVHVDRFVSWFGRLLPVRDENPWFAHEYWSGSVGIWLAHRALWDECRGYDERLIYYNWMETDMIRRLRQSYELVDLGAMTRHDFYHLNHHDPLVEPAGRDRKNANIDRTSRAPMMRPNGHAWGLADCDLAVAPPAQAPVVRTPSTLATFRDAAAFARLMLRLGPELLADVAVTSTRRLSAVARRRAVAVAEGVTGQPVVLWPGAIWRLWQGRRTPR
jgi:hypothetical protein